MRIAHFVHRYPPALGGSEAYFARLSRYLATMGDEVSVFTTTGLALEAFWSKRGACLSPGVAVEDGVEVRRYPLWRWPGQRYVLKALSLVPARRWQCLALPCNPISPPMWSDAGRAGVPFDIVHATAFPYSWPIACGLRLARTLDVPFLLTPFLHLGDPDDPRDRTSKSYTTPALLYLIQSADRVFVQTGLERAALVARGVREEKVVLQGLGVDPTECAGGNREKARQEWGAAGEEILVGHLANKSREKGTVDLLLAAAKLWKSGCRFQLVLAGPEMPNFRSFWRDLTPAGPIRLLGVLDERQKRDFFAGIDVFCLPSRTDSFGLVLLEAWANGVPNVAYRAGGVAEVIRDEEDGLLARCGAVDGLASALARLIAQGDLRRRLGLAGKKRAEQEFGWEPKLRLVRETYLNAIGGRQDKSRRPPTENT